MRYRKLEDYFVEMDSPSERNRTVNIKEPIHYFYKKVSNHFDVNMSTLVSNVLTAWKDKYGEEVKEKILDDLKGNDL